jgi:HD-GYP domain-containing protein (c-di-GMP phosphodiesterase class II)/HAMP domain-containing protein
MRGLGLGDFGSRVAQRVFVLFLACALVPIGVVGLFAMRRSSTEIEKATREQLRRDSKSEGMMIVSRLLAADGLLRALGGHPARWLGPAREGPASQAMPWREVRRAEPRQLPGGPLAPAELRAIAAGRSLLRLEGERRISLVYAPDPARPDSLIAADLAPAYLWTYDRNDPESALTIVDAQGRLVFSSLAPDLALDLAASSIPGLPSETVPAPLEEPPIAEPWLLFLSSHFETPSWYVIRSQSSALTFAPLGEFRAVFRWSLLLAVLVVTALASIQIRRTLQPIHLLSRAALRLGEGRFDTRVAIETRDEFGELGEAFDGMAGRIERHMQALASASAVGVALSHERSEQRLILLVLRALIDTTQSDSAAFLRLNAGGGLEVAATQGVWAGESAAAAQAARSGEIALRPAAGSGTPASLALPLFDHEQRFAALLEVSGPRDESGAPIANFREAEVAAARSLASQAAVAFNNRSLVDEFRVLFEGLIGLTVTALDEKSAYTGGHCRRVPILAEMLADAVCRTREGAFARFEFSPAERYELRIAALLHDFGKVVTPVHVMDKSTKLETIHDRIELIAARYAVLQREAEIAWLRAKLAEAGGEAGEPPVLAELREELAFLRSCNVGGEQMDPAQRDRVLGIAAKRRWRDADGAVAPVLDDNEVENLTIPRGTLNARERKVIEEHAELTIRLLDQLPFPPHLSAVPQIAGSHHERIDGLGYPLGLAGAQITLQGRILGLADVFEALTAPDRPYRDPMTVSQAVEMLRSMVKRGHLDSDLFEVFIRERVHLRYASEQLRPEQLDDAALDELAQIPGALLPGA